MWIRTILTATAVAVGLPAAVAAQQAGETIAVNQSAAAAGAAGVRVLQVRDPVFSGDVVNTNSAGLAQLQLMDDTKLVVGPNSELAIDSFVFATQTTARDVTINAIQGTFRFITGQSQKQAYTINTPVASIGVRGTELDLTVSGDSISMALWGGGAHICDYSRPRLCTDVDETCGIVILDPNGYHWEPDLFARTRLMDELFPWAFQQQPLHAGFRVETRGCEYRNTSPGPRPSGLPSGPEPTPAPVDEPCDGEFC